MAVKNLNYKLKNKHNAKKNHIKMATTMRAKKALFSIMKTVKKNGT